MWSTRQKISLLIETIARQPVFWNIFESIFGADKAKQTLYRSKVDKPCKLMDFGCATGNTTIAFSDFDYVGVDMDKKSIKFATDKWQKHKHIKFEALDILVNGKTLGRFDAILFAGTGHHLSDQLLKKIFIALKNNLKENGHIYYFDTVKPNKNTNILTRWLCSIDRGKNIRTAKETKKIIDSLNKYYRIQDNSIEQVSGTLIPQPQYCYYKLSPR